MKYLAPLILIITFGTFVMAAPGGSHHKIAEYDYHDYLNSNIQSKTFIRNTLGEVTDFVWNFERPSPNEVVRTEIETNADGDIIRYTESYFIATQQSFDHVQFRRYDPSVTPPALYETRDYTPSVVVLTDAMVPGIAWGSAGVINSTLSGESYYTQKKEVLAIEDITLPAGTFKNCLRIHNVNQFGDRSVEGRMDWYCPDLGLVKRINNGRILFELASVTYSE